MRVLPALVFLALGFIACGGSSGSAQSGNRAGGCGVQIFVTPACQQALDSVCCPLETQCAQDPGCLRVSQCINDCKRSHSGRRGDNCMNGCAMQSRAEYCNGACRGQGPDCVTLCTQRGSRTEPMVKWMMIADCSKSVNYPEGVTCDDRT